jgi:hypothetical protein
MVWARLEGSVSAIRALARREGYPRLLGLRESLKREKGKRVGHVADGHFTVSPWQPTLIAIHQQSDDAIWPLERAGKAHRHTC